MMTSEQKQQVVKKFAQSANDSGSPEVQVALITERIKTLTPHFATHIHDHHSKTGLMKLIGRRRRILRYLQNKNPERYGELIKQLGLRK